MFDAGTLFVAQEKALDIMYKLLRMQLINGITKSVIKRNINLTNILIIFFTRRNGEI